MSGILAKEVEEYVDSLLPARDPVVREMERFAARHHIPIVGPACARVLYQLARAIGARRVFELGSAIGYSTLWLARAVGPEGTVFYTDSDQANVDRATAYLSRAGVLGRVQLMRGDALELFESTPGDFDLIFNDVDKRQYPEVLRLAEPRVREGGLFVTDNVLWSGRAAKAAAKSDAATRAIQRFNRELSKSKRFFTTVVPLRDGLAVALKKSEE
ncbi:MAG: O-methyltransferase [Terriglobia bacterium]